MMMIIVITTIAIMIMIMIITITITIIIVSITKFSIWLVLHAPICHVISARARGCPITGVRFDAINIKLSHKQACCMEFEMAFQRASKTT